MLTNKRLFLTPPHFKGVARWCNLALAVILLSGCAVGPNYSNVEPAAQEDWYAQMEKGLEATTLQESQLATWWDIFEDPLLSALQQRAIRENLELKTAFSRLQQARISRGISRADHFPTLSAQGYMQRLRDSENLGDYTAGQEYDWYISELNASWELDLFGGIRRSVEAAQAELEVSTADMHGVLTSLTAEVALNYIELRTYQQRLQVAQKNIETQKKTYDLNNSRFKAGLIDELALQQSLRNLEQSRAQISRLEAAIRMTENNLSVLLGQTPGTLREEFASMGDIPTAPPRIAIGIPAEAMRRRPDIRRAERALAAQSARIGVATAELYPKLRLLGTIGLEAIHSGSDFFDPASRFWEIGPGITWNIFQGGALRLNIEMQEEKYAEALAQYNWSVLKAHQEIENALTSYAKEQIHQEHLAKAVAAAQRTEWLALDRYNAGLVDFYIVLDAQRALFQIEDELNQSKGEVGANLTKVYKAIGGGWQGVE
ncbi:MAG: efflux transporter outer membrane subunit [Desulfuromonadaceae bacterium]|nr:efflux transporter outer membrane subunit [Desulfuromonadaceae bacterium]